MSNDSQKYNFVINKFVDTKEAEKIYKAWVATIEVWIKFGAIMLSIPPSFFPYPPERLDEALTIMEKLYVKSGDVRKANNIQETRMILLTCYNAESFRFNTDEEVLQTMSKQLNMMLGNPEIKDAWIKKLHKERDSWLKLREEGRIVD